VRSEHEGRECIVACAEQETARPDPKPQMQPQQRLAEHEACVQMEPSGVVPISETDEDLARPDQRLNTAHLIIACDRNQAQEVEESTTPVQVREDGSAA